LDAIFHHAPSLMFIKSTDLRYQMVNPKFLELLGKTEEEVLGQDDFVVFSPEDAKDIRRTDQMVTQKRMPLQVELSFNTKLGRRHFLSNKFPLFNEDGEVYGVGGITTDITDKVAAEAEAKITNMVFEAAAEAELVMSDSGKVITNSSFTRITGYPNDHAVSFALSLLHDHPEIEIELRKSGRWQGESTRRRANGENLPIWVSISLVEDINNQKSYIAVFSDISNLKEAEQKLEKLAHYDNLTGLPNRTLFYDRFDSALARSARNNTQTGLLFVDIDRFKLINDSYGHDIGDQILIDAANRITHHIRPGDTVCRLGGDEFTVILADLDRPGRVQNIARRIHSELRKPYKIGNKEIISSASIGIAIYPDDGNSVHLLLKHADTAMYHIKERGRNDIMFFDKTLNAEAEARIALEESLRSAIKSDELFLVFQPRFHITAQRILSVEALIRWRHPEKGMIPPSDFIPLAEESGMVVELGQMVLRKACERARIWNRLSETPVPVSVNLSTRQLHDPDLLSDIQTTLNTTGLPPSLLELEITETMVIEDMDTVIEKLNAIREMGVNLSVDDFGSGYSSLIYLKRLPVSTVKIDRSFVEDVPGDADDENLIQAIISMSHTLNLNVVAEGVETLEQLEFLRNNDCDEIQGYLLAKPDSAEKVEELLLQVTSTSSMDSPRIHKL
ncbi:MAG: EAL domain-containing protein, partial [Chromatiales bacterium]|nr:EAL domain-containing protein [Chromatiales bacterium]